MSVQINIPALGKSWIQNLEHLLGVHATKHEWEIHILALGSRWMENPELVLLTRSFDARYIGARNACTPDAKL